MMNKKTKIWIIVATSLILAGLIIFAGVMTVLKWDFSKLSTVKYETNTYDISQKFKDILVNTNTADITFSLSDDGICKVVCFEAANEKHSVTVNNGTLTINKTEKKYWYEYIGISFKTPKITIYLPESEYGSLVIKESTGDINIPKAFAFESIDILLSTGNVKNYASASGIVKIKVTTGDVYLENVSANSFDLSGSTGDITVKSAKCKGSIKTSLSTGNVKLNDVLCGSAVSKGSTGDIVLRNVVAESDFNITRSTGDVLFEKCDAAELFVKTSTGDVKGSLLSEKVFIANTDTGSVKVPETVTGGKCKITTDTGDIVINIE